MELAYFGAKVIHPQTMAPAVQGAHPHLDPQHLRAGEGGHADLRRADVDAARQGHHQHRARGADQPRRHRHDRRARHGAPAVRRAARGGDLGDPDLPGQLRALDLLRDPAGAGRARRRRWCARAFERELEEGQIQSVDVDPGPGDSRGGRRRHGRHARASPPRCSPRSAPPAVNVRAIAQGASERNISAVVEGSSAIRALRAVHAGLYLSPHTLSIGVIGPGTVGRVLLDQLASQSERLRREFQLDLRVRGVIGSQRMLLADRDIDRRRLARALPEQQPPGGPDALRRARARRLPAAHGAGRLHARARRSRRITRSGWRPASTS